MSDYRPFSALLRKRAAAVVLAAGAAANCVPSFAAASSLSKPDDLSALRTAIVDTEALVSTGDLAAARIRIKDLDSFWDRAVARSAPHAVRHWRIVDRAIDHGLDRALFALHPRSPNSAMCRKALADLLVVVAKVSGNDQARTDGGRT